MKFLRRWFTKRYPSQQRRSARMCEALEPRTMLTGDSIGLYAPTTSTFYLKNDNAPGPANITFSYGPAASGWIPLAGDWNGDGSTTVGLYAPSSSTFLLRNSNSAGAADVMFNFGPAASGWTPIVGDWDGDGDDNVGLYNGTAFFLRNGLAGGAADHVFGFGPINSGWTPVVGDWDGDGDDSVGLYNNDAYFLRNSHAGGIADHVFNFGPTGAGWKPLAGDWDADADDTIGLYSGTTFFLRNALAGGPANTSFNFGPPNAGWTPLVGDWDGGLQVSGTALPGEVLTVTGPLFDPGAATDVVFMDPGGKKLTVTPIAVLADEVSFIVPTWPIPSQFDISTRVLELQVIQDLPGGGQRVSRISQFALPQPGITVSPTSGLSTSEDGDIDFFDVVLDSPPTGNVTIGLNSTDTTEGTISDMTLIFTRTNWDIPRTVVVTGVDDALVDGNVAYSIVVGLALSGDPGYHGLNPPNVAVTNLDNEQSPPGNTIGIYAGTFVLEDEFGSNPNDPFDFGNYRHTVTVTITLIVTGGEIGVFDLGGVVSATVTGVATPTQFSGPDQHYQFDIEGDIQGASSNNTLGAFATLDEDVNDPFYFSSVIFQGFIAANGSSLSGLLDVGGSNQHAGGFMHAQGQIVIPRVN